MSRPNRPVTVLQPFRALRATTNPYIVMLHEALERTPGVSPLMFSYRRALLGRYDVVHLHWPETLLGGRTRVRRLIRALLAHLYLLRLRLFRVPIVRTVHNLDLPGGLDPLEYAYLRAIDRATTVRIHLNARTSEATTDTGPAVVIPHGDYRDWFARFPRNEPTRGQIGFVGLIRRYKNVDGLIRTFRVARESDRTLALHIAGKPSGPELEAEVRAAAMDDSSITLDLRFLDDAALVDAVTSCELLTLPYLHMHNSGVVLTALSLDRPVLVPDNEATRAVSQEVGPGWVLTFEGELTGETLLRSLVESRVPRAAHPDLSRRGWTEAGAAHRAAYLLALRNKRRHRS